MVGMGCRNPAIGIVVIMGLHPYFHPSLDSLQTIYMSTLPSKERIEELRRYATRLSVSVGGAPIAVPVMSSELLALLDAALTMKRLEEWLQAKEEWRYMQSSVVVGEGEMQATLCDGTAAHCADDIVALEAGPNLLAAISAALDAAEARK